MEDNLDKLSGWIGENRATRESKTGRMWSKIPKNGQ